MSSKITVFGGTLTQTASVAASFQTGKRFTYDVSSVSIAGVGNDVFNTLAITINESLEAKHVLNNSKEPARIKRTGKRMVSIAGTMQFDNQTEYQNFISQTEQALIVNFSGPTEIQSGYYDRVQLTMPLMRYEEFKPVVGGAGEVTVSLAGKAKYSVTSATALEVTLVNTRATY